MTDTSQDTSTDNTTDTDAGAASAIGDAVNQIDAAGDDKPSDDADPKGDADDKPEGDKGDDKDGGDDDASGAPEAYDVAAFEMPEGVEFDTEGFEAIEPVLRDLDLSQEQAGKLMEAYGGKIVPMLTARGEKQLQDAGTKLMADMAKELQADEKVGGEHLEESKALTARAIQAGLPDKADRAQFTQFLSESGMGNNRFLMRILANAGREMGEAGTPSSDGGSSGAKTTTEKFYG